MAKKPELTEEQKKEAKTKAAIAAWKELGESATGTQLTEYIGKNYPDVDNPKLLEGSLGQPSNRHSARTILTLANRQRSRKAETFSMMNHRMSLPGMRW